MTRLVYFGLLAFTIYYPLRKWFDLRVNFPKKWPYFVESTTITAIVFILWDIWFTKAGVWNFNPKYFLGIRIFQLPVEEVLFFFIIPFACIFIYEVSKHYFPKGIDVRLVRGLHFLFLLISIYHSIFYWDRLYTLVTALLQAFVCIVVILFSKRIHLTHFYYGYFFSLIPFFLVNGVLTKLPVVWYNNAENMQIRIFSIPLDDAFYLYNLLLLNIFLYELFRKYGNVLIKR